MERHRSTARRPIGEAVLRRVARFKKEFECVLRLERARGEEAERSRRQALGRLEGDWRTLSRIHDRTAQKEAQID